MNGPRLSRAAAQTLADFRTGRLTRRAFLTRATALGMGAALARSVAGAPPAAAQEAVRPEGPGSDTVRIQMDVRPLVDPRRFDWPEMANVTRGWLEYLVEYQPDGALRGMLLRDWEVNDDATVFRLNLRAGVTWSDGRPFTAADVTRMMAYWCEASVPGNVMATHLASLLDPDTQTLRAGGAEALDDLTVVLRPARPDVGLMVGLSDYPAAVLPEGFSAETMIENPVGTGPYRPVTHVPGVEAVLERREEHGWWGESLPDWGPVAARRLHFRDLGTDPATWLAAAQEGTVDMLYETVGRFIAAADALGWARYRAETAATVVLRGNQRAAVADLGPVYADRDVRRALALATDNAICLELGAGGNGSVAANHHVAPVQPDYADIGPSEFDPAQARALMVRAGHPDLAHEIVTLDDGLGRRTGEAVVALLTDAGISARQRILPGSRFWAEWKSFPLSITEWNHRPLGVQTLALAYRSGAAWNESSYSNPEFDAALDRALAEPSDMGRQPIMAELEGMLREDAVIVQPYWRALTRHAHPDLTGADMHPSLELRLYRLGWRV